MRKRLERAAHLARALPGKIGLYVLYPATGDEIRFHADMPIIELLKSRESRDALEALVPGISRTPDSMTHQTLRQVLASLERKNEQQIGEIDARLRMV